MSENGFTKAVRLALRLDIPAEYGKRRVRRLEAALDQERATVAVGEIKYAELMAQYEQRGEIISRLIEQGAVNQGEIDRLNAEIEDLQYSLDTAISSAWANANPVSFIFADRPKSGPEDYATAPIDLADLRADLASSEPLEGKITQLNPDTGRHDTVEIKRPVIVRSYQHSENDLQTPTSVPGMVLAG